MAKAITRCPQCRERVSPFAAGCAICGADLEAARAAIASRRPISLPLGLQRIFAHRPDRRPAVGGRIDWAHVVVALLVALVLPPVGCALGLYWALQRQRSGERLMMAVMLGAAALAVAVFLAPVWFWSHLLRF